MELIKNIILKKIYHNNRRTVMVDNLLKIKNIVTIAHEEERTTKEYANKAIKTKNALDRALCELQKFVTIVTFMAKPYFDSQRLID